MLDKYPLGHNTDEIERLDKQAYLLHDSSLDQLATNAASCLEIGCGAGSNIPILLLANPHLRYHGIDTSDTAINFAKHRFDNHPQIKFTLMDATDIKINEKFDLIVCKLVLWSIPAWRNVINQARDLLQPNGVLYIMEPCNQLIQFYPPKPMTKMWMQRWDDAVKKSGRNSYIGSEIDLCLQEAGFEKTKSTIFTVTAFGYQHDKYNAIIENFKGFYTGAAANNLELNTSCTISENRIVSELNEYNDDSIVMDCLSISIGIKSHNHNS